MKDIVPSPPPTVRNEAAAIQALFQQNVVPSYGRFDIVLSHGAGRYLYDITGRRYLDLGGGIAVSSLGHRHPDRNRTSCPAMAASTSCSATARAVISMTSRGGVTWIWAVALPSVRLATGTPIGTERRAQLWPLRHRAQPRRGPLSL